MLDLESEDMRGLGSIPTGGNILPLDFFHIVKPLMPILAYCQFYLFVKNPCDIRYMAAGLLVHSEYLRFHLHLSEIS